MTLSVAMIPEMTSNTTPSGTASASGVYLTYAAYLAFDIDTLTGGYAVSTNWISNIVAGPWWIQYQFSEGVTATTYYIQGHSGHAAEPEDFKLQGSNNGTDWTDLDVVTGKESWDTAGEDFTIDTPASYSYYRLYISSVIADDGYACIRKIQLYADMIDEAARNTDPGESNVLDGIKYKIQNASKEGTAIEEAHTADEVLKSAGGNYDDDNLSVGNVRPVAFGLSQTGTLANLAATDAAYLALEATRNDDGGADASDLDDDITIKIKDVEIAGNHVCEEGGGTGATAEEVAAAVLAAEITTGVSLATALDELHKLQGLQIAAPMTVTPTARVAGAIDLHLTGDGITTTTVTRQA